MATNAPNLPAASKVPAHVPPDLVLDCPIAMRKVVYENVFTTMIPKVHREQPPIYWCPTMYPDNTGSWVVRRHDDLKDIYADDDLFTKKGFSSFSKMIGEDWDVVPTELTGDKHAAFRRVLNPVFAPAKMAALDNQVRERARQYISAFKARGSCDFVEEFAVPYPVSIFLDLFGLPQDETKKFLLWEADLLHTTDMQARMKATRDVEAYLLDAIEQRRKKPTDDLISQALTFEINGQKWSEMEVFGYCFNLYVGGLDTVTANIGLHMYHLATHLDQQAELRADPKKLTTAIEEMLRAYAAVTTFRTCTRETEFRGVKMRPGDKIAMSTALTGLDPEAYEAPGEVRFDRKPSHLTFGSSSHRCLGMHLARRELQIALTEMLAGLPEFRIEPEQPHACARPACRPDGRHLPSRGRACRAVARATFAQTRYRSHFDGFQSRYALPQFRHPPPSITAASAGPLDRWTDSIAVSRRH
jgi:cytochrome P450